MSISSHSLSHTNHLDSAIGFSDEHWRNDVSTLQQLDHVLVFRHTPLRFIRDHFKCQYHLIVYRTRIISTRRSASLMSIGATMFQHCSNSTMCSYFAIHLYDSSEITSNVNIIS